MMRLVEKWFGGPKAPAARGRRRTTVRLQVEGLEERSLMAAPANPIPYDPDTVFKLGDYWIDVPSSYDSTHQTQTELFVWSHGCGGFSDGDIYNVRPTAGSPTYIAITVDGREGGCWDVNVDPDRLLAAVADVKTHFNIDPQRVVLGGFSSGGDLTYRTAFTHSTEIAGVLAENTAPFRDTGLSQQQALAAPFHFHVVHLAHTEDLAYPIDQVRPETDAVQAAGSQGDGWATLQRIERPGTHYDESNGNTGTVYDLQTLLLPHLADGWLSPPGAQQGSPVVSGLNPGTGPAAGNTSVVITGQNFTGASAVSFGGTPAANFTIDSASQITATAPAHGAGTVDVIVTTAAGASATSAADQYVYAGPPAPPLVGGLSPATGPVAGNTSVIITGQNFTGATAVSFGSTPAVSFVINSAAQIMATVPAHSAGTVDVTVTTAAGTSAQGPSDQYVYTEAPPPSAPVVTGLDPATGGRDGGTTVTITGQNLAGATAVAFGGVPASNFVVTSAGQITATAPPHAAGTVDITVIGPAGSSTLTAADQYVYTAPPGVPPGVPGTLAFAAASLSVNEGGTATLTVVRTGGSDGTVSVPYAVSVPGTLPLKNQAGAGVDFQGALSGTLTFPSGQTQATLSFPVPADDRVEDTKFFTVTLSAPSGGASLGSPAAATVAIQDANLPAVPDALPKLTTLQGAGSGFGKSEEHYKDFITKAYGRYLSRVPDAQGFAYWVGLMQLYETSGHKQGLRQEQIEAGFLDSPEYLGRYGGAGEAWVRGIYHDLLNRGADANGLQFWLAALQAGASPTDVALGFSTSLERLRNRITETYFTLLGRAPDDFGLNYWVAVFQFGGTTEDINSGFVGSTEYYNKAEGAAGNPARWVREAYLDILFRPARTDELSYWMDFLKQ